MAFVAACVDEPLTDLWPIEWYKPFLSLLRYNKFILNISSMSVNKFYGFCIRLGTSPGFPRVLMSILVGILVGHVTRGSGSPVYTGL